MLHAILAVPGRRAPLPLAPSRLDYVDLQVAGRVEGGRGGGRSEHESSALSLAREREPMLSS